MNSFFWCINFFLGTKKFKWL